MIDRPWQIQDLFHQYFYFWQVYAIVCTIEFFFCPEQPLGNKFTNGCWLNVTSYLLFSLYNLPRTLLSVILVFLYKNKKYGFCLFLGSISASSWAKAILYQFFIWRFNNSKPKIKLNWFKENLFCISFWHTTLLPFTFYTKNFRWIAVLEINHLCWLLKCQMHQTNSCSLNTTICMKYNWKMLRYSKEDKLMSYLQTR